MLHSLTSSLPDAKTAVFEPGLNVALAVRTRKAPSKDSRNAVGKTSFITALDFCLGSSAGPNHLLRRPELEKYEFRLDLTEASARHTISRSGQAPNAPAIDGDIVTLDILRNQLGRDLFALAGTEFEPSFRSLVAYYLRAESTGGFNEPLRTVSRQTDLATQLPLAYLFGLDINLVARAAAISDSRKNVSALRRATKDPVFGRTLGNTADLDAEIATLHVRRTTLSNELRSFRVVERYAELRESADELTRRIRSLNDRIFMAQQRSGDILLALETEEQEQPDHAYLDGVFEQVGLAFSTLTRRRFEEVAAFHASVVRNRRSYLEREREAADQDARDAQNELGALDERRADVMQRLDEGGALETFQELQQAIGEVEGRIAELEQRRAAVDSLKEAQKHLTREALILEETVRADIAERRAQLAEISAMFTQFAFALYGAKRPATLTIQERESGYAFYPTIGGDRSAGVRGMSIFCFDLTMAVVAKRAGRGPDFLVHDSHLFDAVEARQVGAALNLASQVCDQENMQYIATINSDALEVALADTPNLIFNQCLTLTDEYESGGFFGMRFN